MNRIFHEVCGDVVDDYTVHSTLMSSDDVTSAIKKLKPGKSMDRTGYHQIITVMVPHYSHVIFLHYLIV